MRNILNINRVNAYIYCLVDHHDCACRIEHEVSSIITFDLVFAPFYYTKVFFISILTCELEETKKGGKK